MKYRQQKYRMLDLTSEDIRTTHQAVEAAGLDWEVASGTLQGQCFDRESMKYEWRKLDNHRCIYRTDTGHPLGNSIVGAGFGLVQNADAFACFDGILDTQDIRFTSGGWYHDGGSVFLQAKLPDGITFDNGDQLERYLIIAQGHTGQQSLTMRFTHVRPSCTNTLMAALSDSTHSYSLKHTANIKERIDVGVRFMSKGLTHLARVEKKYHTMSKIYLSQQQTINFLKLAYDRPIDEELKDWRNWKNIEPIFEAPKGAEFCKGTLWGAYNILTEYEDHHTKVNRSNGVGPLSPATIRESRQVRAMFGTSTVNRKLKAFKLAEAVINGNLDISRYTGSSGYPLNEVELEQGVHERQAVRSHIEAAHLN